MLTLLVTSIAIAGCIGTEGDPGQEALDPQEATDDVEWEASDEAAMGFSAGAKFDGAQAWASPTDRCPLLAAEILPQSGTESLTLEVTPEPAGNTGVGAYAEITLFDPNGDEHQVRNWPEDELRFEVEDPTPGPWSLIITRGAGAESLWPVTAQAAGVGQAPLDAFLFEDC